MSIKNSIMAWGKRFFTAGIPINIKDQHLHMAGFDPTVSSIEGIYAKGYYKNKTLATVINRIASVASELPFDENQEAFSKIELVAGESWQAFLFKAVVNYLVSGEFFVCGYGIGKGKWSTMFVPASKDVQMFFDANDKRKPTGYTVAYMGKSYSFSPDQVFHFKMPSVAIDTTDNYARGFSPLIPLSQAWNTDNEMSNNLYGFFVNRGANGVFVSEKGETFRDTKQIENDQLVLDKTLGVGSQSGKVAILQQALRYVHLGLKADDAAAIDTYQQKVLRDVCACYGVGSQLFGDQASSTYSNYAEARRSMYEDVVVPMVRRIVYELEKFIFSKYLQIPINSIIIAESKIMALRENEDAKIARIEKLVAMGILTIEEAKTELGYDRD